MDITSFDCLTSIILKTDLYSQTKPTTALPKALLLSAVSDDVALLNLLPPGGNKPVVGQHCARK